MVLLLLKSYNREVRENKGPNQMVATLSDIKIQLHQEPEYGGEV